MKNISVAKYGDLQDRKPEYALVGEVDLVVLRIDDEVSVFYGRCLHRGALMSDGFVSGNNLVCGVHNWDYRLDTGVSEYANCECPETEQIADSTKPLVTIGNSNQQNGSSQDQ